MEITMVPSQFLSVVLEEESGEDPQSYSQHPAWQNYYPPMGESSSISDQEMRNLTKNLPKALLAECTVEISRTPVNQSEKLRKPCFDARVSPIFNSRKSTTIPALREVPALQQYLPPPPQLLHRSEWMEEHMDVQDLLTGVEAVYSDNESGGEYEEAASVSIFPITVAKVEKSKSDKIKKQDINKFNYPCEHCPNVYSNRGALWQHSVATHSVEKTCECKICGRKFYRNCSLALHLKSHSEEEYCQCKECGKSFNRLANLERHMKVHTEAELFPCTICNRVFRDKANLLRHAVVHVISKTFHCDVCNKYFKSQDHLEMHSKTHTDSSLSCCTSLAEVMPHDATHSQDTCKFTDKTILKKHTISHTGERLACTLCSIDFTQKSSLLRHIKRMHSQDSDGVFDPSLFIEEKSSGTDNKDGSSENSSVKDMDLDDYPEGEQPSTAEIRKVLGSPVKSQGFANVEQYKSSEKNAVEIHKMMLASYDTSIESVISNHTPKEDSLSSSVSEPNIEVDRLEKPNHDTDCGEKVVNQVIENVESKFETCSKPVDVKQQVKADSTDPLSSVDINTMHTNSLRSEKSDLTTVN